MRALCFLVLLLIAACESDPRPAIVPTDSTAYYTYRDAAPNGTGKVYMDREIADVTEADSSAAFLDRPERAETEFPTRVVEALDLQPTDVVADIGAGTGYFTFRLSPAVPRGHVLAVDIQPEMLDHIRRHSREKKASNVEPILGTITDPNLPADSVDVALIVFSYTEFSHPREMIENIAGALRPGGRLVLVEYRGEDPTIPVDPLHRITEAQARREMQAAGLAWVETRSILPQQHFMVFEKPARY